MFILGLCVSILAALVTAETVLFESLSINSIDGQWRNIGPAPADRRVHFRIAMTQVSAWL